MRILSLLSTATVVIGIATAAVAAPIVTPTDTTGAAAIQLAQAGAGTTTVRVKSAILRSSPDTKSKKLTSLRRGTKVTVIDKSNGWTHVRVGKREGYVSSSLLNA